MAKIATHTAARTPVSARLGKGCNKEHAHWLPCPRSCCCKSSICRVANARPAGSPFLFRVPCSVFRVPCFVFCISCFVLCALQLSLLQSKAHDVDPLNRLSAMRVCCKGFQPACCFWLAATGPGVLPALLLAATAAALFQMVCNVQIAHAPPACQHVRLGHLFTASAASAAFAAPHAWPRLA